MISIRRAQGFGILILVLLAGGPFPFASFPALFAIHIAVDHVSLLIADSSWIVRPRVTAAIHQSSFEVISRYFTEIAETCHCSDIKCAVLITIPSPSRVAGF